MHNQIETEYKPKIAQLAKLEGMDPDEYRALKAERESFRKIGITDPKQFPEVLKSYVREAVEPLEKKLTASEARENAVKLELAKKAVETKITEQAIKAGILPEVLPDVIRRAQDAGFQLLDGSIVARKGDLPIYSTRNPSIELTIEEWIGMPAESYLPRSFFMPSGGGGAEGGLPKPRVGARKLINPTPQEMGAHMDEIIKGEVVVVRQ